MPKPSPVSHLVFARANTGRSTHLGMRLSSLIEPALGAPGCLNFALQQSLVEPDLWMVTGVWSSEETMNAWFVTPPLSVFAELVREFVVTSLDFQTFKQVSAVQAQAECQQRWQKMAS